MKVKFIETVNISDKIILKAGSVFEAREDGENILIRMKDDSTVVAPKKEINSVLEIIEG